MSQYRAYFVPRAVDPTGQGILDWFDGREGWVPDYFQGGEGYIPDDLQNGYEFINHQPVGELLGFSLSALSNDSEIELKGDLLKLVEDDPTVTQDDEKVRQLIMDQVEGLEIPTSTEYVTVAIEIPNNKANFEFGGQRAGGNMLDQLKGFWKPEYRATWKVGANPLTWMIRHVGADRVVTGTIKLNCEGYEANYTTAYSFSDTLDLRPHGVGNNDFSVLSNPGESPYDTATVVLGTVYHDILRRRDDLAVSAEFERTGTVNGAFGN